MNTSWLIQSNTFSTDTTPIVHEVKSQGMEVCTVDYSTLKVCDPEIASWWPNHPVVCYGDIDFVRYVQTLFSFPGASCNFHNMRCSTYYAYLGQHLLNDQYIMMPLGDLQRRWKRILEQVKYRPLFVRPDSGAKPFSGFLIAPHDKHEIQALSREVGPETPVVVAPKKSISSEYRFVICDRQVIAGCRYLPEESPEYSTLSFRLAKIISLEQWQPDICYTVDIAESNGKAYLLEINSFSCAGLYSCDIGNIVRSVSEIAHQRFLEDCV